MRMIIKEAIEESLRDKTNVENIIKVFNLLEENGEENYLPLQKDIMNYVWDILENLEDIFSNGSNTEALEKAIMNASKVCIPYSPPPGADLKGEKL